MFPHCHTGIPLGSLFLKTCRWTGYVNVHVCACAYPMRDLRSLPKCITKLSVPGIGSGSMDEDKVVAKKLMIKIIGEKKFSIFHSGQGFFAKIDCITDSTKYQDILA